MVRAQQTTAMLTTFNEIDMTAVQELRAGHKDRFEKAHGFSLGLVSFFAWAAAQALKQFPVLNAQLDGHDIVYHDYVHLGIAVSTERGLVVPVLRNVESMSLPGIEAEIKRVAVSARDGKLSIQELSGGTFTITNGGIFGSLLSTPILNPPQTGILGMHVIQDRPVAIQGQVLIRPMMYVALSYDHRLADGQDAVSFLVRLKQVLEDPIQMLLEI
jgi:2-oxoglutarate dehydrogenase E2 component (dihydrolipoamide succinyltransferase)